ncbi:MAG: hypothetical protein IJB96_03135 [Lachnospira sp.]|nr:hypothetical protein [Lachnospira sp.]
MLMHMKYIVLFYMIVTVFMISSCTYGPRMYEYYSEKDNYVCATGTVTGIRYNESRDALYIEFDNLDPQFSDHNFKIEGDNLSIVKSNGIDDKLKLGEEVEFFSATRYFGDGYVMPIVGITVDGEVLLEFDEGYENLLKVLKDEGYN